MKKKIIIVEIIIHLLSLFSLALVSLSFVCQSAFFMRKAGSAGIGEVKFLADDNFVVVANFEGTLLVWELVDWSA